MPSASNRSLERGIELLRAFRPGSSLLRNGELAERTGLSRATVSRLTQTLVATGFLEHVPSARAYRLAAPVLSLAHAMHAGSELLQLAAPPMRELAEGLRINVGLAVADRGEMVYLESIRFNRRASLRRVVSGQRVPMELTSLGRAWLARADAATRRELFAHFASRRSDWPAVRRQILQSIAQVEREGWCAAAWQSEIVAVATPLELPGQTLHVLNASISSREPMAEVALELAKPLLELSTHIAQLHRRSLGD